MNKEFKLNVGEKILHLLKSLTMDDIGMVDKIFSFAIYTDKRVKPQEYDAFIKVLADFFEANELSGESEKLNYVVEQVNINLENYSKNFQSFIEDKSAVLKFIVDNERDDIARAIYSVYIGDGELSKEESNVVQYFADNLNMQFEIKGA